LNLETLSHQALCSLGIAATLHQCVENKTILIDGPPQPGLLSLDGMTTSSGCHLSPSLPADRLRMSLAKCLPNFSAQSLTVWRDFDTTFAQQIFDHTQLNGNRK
jgi:hypothetical protein